MRLHKIVVVIAAASLSAFAIGCGAHAQEGEPASVAAPAPEGAHEEGMHPFLSLDAIQLAPAQKERVAKIRADLAASAASTRAARDRYADALAAQIEAGSIDRAKLDVAKAALVASMTEAPLQAALRELHATLDPAQRKALVDATRERMMKHGRGPEGHGRGRHDTDGADADKGRGRGDHDGPDGHGPGNPMKRLAKELDLTDAQKRAFKDEMKEMRSHHGGRDHKAGFEGMREQMKAVAEGFVSDSFDPVALGVGKRGKPMAEEGATRAADLAEVAVRILNPEQRTKLAAKVREHKMPF